MDETLAELGEHIQAALGDTVDSATVAYGELTLEVRASEIVQAVRFLRDDTSCLFVNLTDICGVDYPSRDKRFEVVYHFLSPKQNMRIRVKLKADDRPSFSRWMIKRSSSPKSNLNSAQFRRRWAVISGSLSNCTNPTAPLNSRGRTL